MIDNVARSEIKELQRQVKRLGTMANTGYTSITEGGLRVASQEGLNVQGSAVVSGTLNVTGLEVVDGTLKITGHLVVSGDQTISGPLTISGDTTVTGTLDVSGDFTIDGDTTQNGDYHLKGKTDITGDTTVTGDMDVDGPLKVTGDTTLGGTTDITGATTLKDDLTVSGGGKIKVGALTLDPSVSGAGTVGGVTAPVTLLLKAPTVVMTAAAQVDGNLNAAGGVTITNLPTISGKTSNLYLDTADMNTLKVIV